MDHDETAAGWHAHVGEELRKTYKRYQEDGFFAKYLHGQNILDIGYKGYVADAQPIFPHAIGVDMDYPGYDGRTLPFPAESQDAVFASHTLEHIPDYRQALREWFRVLRIGGHIVIAVPHQYLYERTTSLPSRFNGDHKRLYTAASLLTEIEDSLDPLSYRVRHLEDNDEHFDYSIPPERHAGGCYELVVVIQRIRRPDYADAVLNHAVSGPPPGHYLTVAKLDDHEPLLSIESGAPPRRVLILKLDHRGDFVMAVPAFRTLRERFPGAHITLACGSWTEPDARQLGLFDDVITADFFPEVASQVHAGFSAADATARFTKAIAGKQWDLAIDLRVDPDTRHLLAEVDAAHRAGFGTRDQFPYLDIFLDMINPTLECRAYRRLLIPVNFATKIGIHDGFEIIHKGDRVDRRAGDFLIYGPYEKFEAGEWTIEILMEPLREAFDIMFDVCSQGGGVIHEIGRLRITQGAHPVFKLRLEQATAGVEIRLRAGHAGSVPPFRFLGGKASKKGSFPALHQQEMQCLLANLVSLRMENPFAVREVG